jgi:hypothetical protein
MPSLSRVNDHWTGICCCHLDHDPICIPMGGFIITASGGHKSSGPGVARIQDMTVGYAIVGSQVSGCHSGKVITGDVKHITG